MRKLKAESQTRLASFTVSPVGVITTPFREKFGIPRQPTLVPSARGEVHLFAHPHLREMLYRIETFSHLWLIFQFHRQNARPRDTHDFKISVRPPRLGGAKKVGIYATRSPHHPNQLGLSVVKLDEVILPKNEKSGAILRVSGVDLLDQTPIVDVKPYLPYADEVVGANSGWANGEVERHRIHWSKDALEQFEQCASHVDVEVTKLQLKTLIEEVLSVDPRPAFQSKKKAQPEREYAFTLYNLDIHWSEKSVLTNDSLSSSVPSSMKNPVLVSESDSKAEVPLKEFEILQIRRL